MESRHLGASEDLGFIAKLESVRLIQQRTTKLTTTVSGHKGKASTMKSLRCVAACLCFIWATCSAELNASSSLSSHQILPDNFKPPQVFKNANLLRNINLEKGYVKETVNVVIENIDAAEQNTYYIPFKADTIGHVGGLEVRDKKNPEVPAFRNEVVEYDPYRYPKTRVIRRTTELTD